VQSLNTLRTEYEAKREPQSKSLQERASFENESLEKMEALTLRRPAPQTIVETTVALFRLSSKATMVVVTSWSWRLIDGD
jgi:hypothetical protein